MAVGFIYFRAPNEGFAPSPGAMRLLFTPQGEDESFIVDLFAYKEPKAEKQ